MNAAIEKLRQVAGAFVAALVVAMYSYAWWHGFWPPGHPWSGLTLSLLAVQNLLPLKSKPFAGVLVAVCLVVSAVLWGLSVRAAGAERDRSKAASVSPAASLDPRQGRCGKA